MDNKAFQVINKEINAQKHKSIKKHFIQVAYNAYEMLLLNFAV